MMPWLHSSNSGDRLPDDLKPRVRKSMEPAKRIEPGEIVITASAESPPGFERTDEPPTRRDYGRGLVLTFEHRRVLPG